MAERGALDELVQLARRALGVTASLKTNRIGLETLLDDLHELTPRVLAIPQDETDRRQTAIGVVEAARELLGTAIAETGMLGGASGGWPAVRRAKREQLERELGTLERALVDAE